MSGQQNRYFYQQLYNRLTEVITNYAKGLGTDLEEIDVPLRIQVAFITSALLGLIIRWLDGGLIYTPRYHNYNRTMASLKAFATRLGES